MELLGSGSILDSLSEKEKTPIFYGSLLSQFFSFFGFKTHAGLFSFWIELGITNRMADFLANQARLVAFDLWP